MKKTATFLRLSLLAMAFLFTTNAKAVDYYGCAGIPLTIAGDGNFDNYIWDVISVKTGLSIHTELTKSFTYTIADAGSYEIKLTVKDANTCASDPITYKYYALPPIAVTLAMATDNPTAYCISDAATGTTIKATGKTPDAAVLGNAAVGDYKWYSATSASGTATTGTLIPSATTETYKVTEAIAGNYFFLATAQYTIPTGDHFVGTRCIGQSVTQEIKVNALPLTPTIKITTL